MISTFGQWLQSSLDIVFFVYGLAFVSMGLAIVFQPVKESRFKLASIIWLLAAFGLTHGGNELLDMWAIIKGRHPVFDMFRWGILVGSFFFLFEFGRRVLRIGAPEGAALPKRLHGYLGPIIIFVILAFGLVSSDFWNTGSTMARYFLGFPGAVLTGLGLLLYAKREEESVRTLKLEPYFQCAALAFMAYGILGGLVPPWGDFFPANWLNTKSFMSVIGIPVQVFRAMCAIIIAYSVIHILTIFRWEADTRLRLALTSGEARLRSVLESTADGIIVIDEKGEMQIFNATATKLLGYRAEEVLGKNVSMLVPQPHRERHDSYVENYLRTGLAKIIGQEQEVTCQRKDGREFPAALRVTEMNHVGKRMFIGTIQDITERREAADALRLKEEQFQKSQKLEVVGTLAGGIAHDFNNLLCAIGSYAEFIRQDSDPNDSKHSDSQEIKKAVDRAALLTRQLLAFGRKQVLLPRVADLNSIFADIEKLLRKSIPENIILSTALHQKLGHVKVDVSQIEQVLLNLAINSRDAMPHGGKLIFETSNMDLSEPVSHADFALPAGNYAMIAVTDTGTGMDEATQSRIFEPFFTTKGPTQGSGLGLASVFGIVKQSGGYISVYSAPEKGTTFKIYLPRVESPVDVEERDQTSTAELKGSETILLAEDDLSVKTTSVRILKNCGYRVLTASDGEEALRIAEQFKEPIHLLLTDVIMPKMDGLQLAQRIAALRPQIKIVFMSGYTTESLIQREILDKDAPFITKPFAPGVLALALRQVLDKV